MPYMPDINEGNPQSLYTTEFKGLNVNLPAGDGELAWMENLSDRAYPLLAPRAKRTTVQTISKPQSLLGKEKLLWVAGGKLYYDGVYKDMHESTGTPTTREIFLEESDAARQLVSMGSCAVAWPERVWYNAADDSSGNCGAISWVQDESVTAKVCRHDGTEYDLTDSVVGTTPPESPANGTVWIDTSGDEHVFKQWTSASAEWVQISTVYVKIQNVTTTGSGLGGNFSVYDSVKITGLRRSNDLGSTDLNNKVDEQLENLCEEDMIVYACGDSYIVVAGMLSAAVTCTYSGTEQVLKIERRVPLMDYVMECDNRLWGCRHGLNSEGEYVNEIYASKQGDFKNWFCFMGLSSDSYQVSVGTDGPFTGCAVVNGYPTFFKEGYAHRIGGSLPSTFTMTTTELQGIQEGSWKSAVVVNGVLYYKANHCVMAYDGSLPQCVSNPLGHMINYSDARGGTYKNRYYLSMKDDEDAWHLFVYDTDRALWHREDDLKCLSFARIGTSFYTIDEETGDLIDLNGEADGTVEDDIQWRADFATVGYTNEEQKYLSRFNIRMRMNTGDIVKMYIQYDSDGEWVYEGRMLGKCTRTFMIPVSPRRCDHCQLRLEGEGDVRVFSIGRVYESGCDG